MKKNNSKIGTYDVWDFIGFSDDESSEMRLRMMIFRKIMEEVKAAGITPRKLDCIIAFFPPADLF
jgi:hypothetical protein